MILGNVEFLEDFRDYVGDRARAEGKVNNAGGAIEAAVTPDGLPADEGFVLGNGIYKDVHGLLEFRVGFIEDFQDGRCLIVFNKGVVFWPDKVGEFLENFVMGIDGLDVQVNDVLALALPCRHAVHCIHIGLGIGKGELLPPLFLNDTEIGLLGCQGLLNHLFMQCLRHRISPFFVFSRQPPT